jgi:hypothetical protein
MYYPEFCMLCLVLFLSHLFSVVAYHMSEIISVYKCNPHVPLLCCCVLLIAPIGAIISGSSTVYKVSSSSPHHLHSLSLHSVLGSIGMSPKVSWKQLVAAMKWNSARSVFCVVNSFLRSIAAPPILFRSICLAGWCTVQCRSRCSTVSSFCWHAGHVSELFFLMQCRCLASGACPVLSCVRMLACFLSRFAMSLRYLSDTAVGSVFFSSE